MRTGSVADGQTIAREQEVLCSPWFPRQVLAFVPWFGAPEAACTADLGDSSLQVGSGMPAIRTALRLLSPARALGLERCSAIGDAVPMAGDVEKPC